MKSIFLALTAVLFTVGCARPRMQGGDSSPQTSRFNTKLFRCTSGTLASNGYVYTVLFAGHTDPVTRAVISGEPGHLGVSKARGNGAPQVIFQYGEQSQLPFLRSDASEHTVYQGTMADRATGKGIFVQIEVYWGGSYSFYMKDVDGTAVGLWGSCDPFPSN